MTGRPARAAGRPRPWIFKDEPENGDWASAPWEWTIPGRRCDIDGGDLRNRLWIIVYANALIHAARCPVARRATIETPVNPPEQS